MENNSKYYTPEIEEFHVGFEYQQKYSIQQTESVVIEWRDKVIDRPNQIPIVEQLLGEVKMDGRLIRVKYLDREDIESLGFKFVMTSYDGYYIKNDFELAFSYDKRVQIKKKSEGTIFLGDIKNKSELKTLMKWLNIN